MLDVLGLLGGGRALQVQGKDSDAPVEWESYPPRRGWFWPCPASVPQLIGPGLDQSDSFSAAFEKGVGGLW